MRFPAIVPPAVLFALAGCAARPAARAPDPPPAPVAVEEPAPEPAPAKLVIPCGDADLVGCTNGCDDKRVEDCVTLGSMYLSGAIVSIDKPRALSLFRAACDDGSARGCLRLADAHHAGLIPGDVEEVALYRKACDAGANHGCLAAARAFLAGRGVGRDPALAATLLTRICALGNAPACVELGRLYRKGEGVQRDPRRAAGLFEKACKLGNDEGCLRAGGGEEMLPPRE